MTSMVIKVAERPPSLVSGASMRVPVGGKIRPGIKVLTKAAKENPEAHRLYRAGVEAGKSFDQIESDITTAIPSLRSPLIMRNVPFFTVRPGDFANPALARQIMDLYATDRNDGLGRRLYRFPAVFPSDDLQVVMPNALRCYSRSELRYWSEPGADRARYCLMRAPVPRSPEGKVVRMFGGRQIVRRLENDGRCDPLACREFQAKECNLSGSFIFYIPGVASLHPIVLPFTSIYALIGAEATFAMVRSLRGGRISGFLEAGQTFWFSKVEREVPHLDPDTGRPKRVRHLIITLEANVDPTRLLRQRDDAAFRGSLAEQGAETLEGAARVIGEETAQGASPEAAAGTEAGSGTDDEQTCPQPEPLRAAPAAANEAPATLPTEAVQAKSPQAAADSAASDGLANLHALLTEIGIEPQRYEAFAKKKWGAGWTLNPRGLARALAHVQEQRADPAALRDQIEGEFDTFVQ